MKNLYDIDQIPPGLNSDYQEKYKALQNFQKYGVWQIAPQERPSQIDSYTKNNKSFLSTVAQKASSAADSGLSLMKGGGLISKGFGVEDPKDKERIEKLKQGQIPIIPDELVNFPVLNHILTNQNTYINNGQIEYKDNKVFMLLHDANNIILNAIFSKVLNDILNMFNEAESLKQTVKDTISQPLLEKINNKIKNITNKNLLPFLDSLKEADKKAMEKEYKEAKKMYFNKLNLKESLFDKKINSVYKSLNEQQNEADLVSQVNSVIGQGGKWEQEGKAAMDYYKNLYGDFAGITPGIINSDGTAGGAASLENDSFLSGLQQSNPDVYKEIQGVLSKAGIKGQSGLQNSDQTKSIQQNFVTSPQDSTTTQAFTPNTQYAQDAAKKSEATSAQFSNLSK